MRFKLGRPSAGTVIATVALIFAVSGVAGALPGKNSVDGGDIKKGAIKTKHFAKKAVAPKVKAVAAHEDGSITLLQNDTKTIVSKSVKAGRYAVIAKATVATTGDADYVCGLYADGEQIDRHTINLPSGVGNQAINVALIGVAKLSGQGDLALVCSSTDDLGSVYDAHLIATSNG
ncbi:MAG TPA: hypothetical protein VIL04_10120 [Solirubrobacterales bacterium]|jgi:hypothetical protein